MKMDIFRWTRRHVCIDKNKTCRDIDCHYLLRIYYLCGNPSGSPAAPQLQAGAAGSPERTVGRACARTARALSLCSLAVSAADFALEGGGTRGGDAHSREGKHLSGRAKARKSLPASSRAFPPSSPVRARGPTGRGAMAEEPENVLGYQAGAGIQPNDSTAFGGSIPANAPNMEIMALDKMLLAAKELPNEFLMSEVRRWNMRIQRYQVCWRS
eukprot:SAG31_NODE_7389_length_1702_cov_2.509669_1_plen_213_part_00